MHWKLEGMKGNRKSESEAGPGQDFCPSFAGDTTFGGFALMEAFSHCYADDRLWGSRVAAGR